MYQLTYVAISVFLGLYLLGALTFLCLTWQKKSTTYLLMATVYLYWPFVIPLLLVLVTLTPFILTVGLVYDKLQGLSSVKATAEPPTDNQN